MSGTAGIFNGLDTVLLRVRCLDEARAWYSEKLGLRETFLDEGERLAVFDLAGTSLTLWELKAGESFPPLGHAGTYPIFSVGDARQTWALLRERGVAVGEVVEAGGVTFFTFLDPDGNNLEACQVG